MATAWRSFGWDVHEVDGHDPEAISALVERARGCERPTLLAARTTFGKGVSFMESKIEWHYWPLSEEQYRKAIAELTEAES
jgi:transketolase